MKVIMKKGNHYKVRPVDKRVHNASIAELVKQKREAAMSVVVTVPEGTSYRGMSTPGPRG